jgi:uncharacterized protein YycO
MGYTSGMSIRTALLTAALPITKAIGKIHAPWTHKKLTAKDYDAVASLVHSGDVLLSHTAGDFSNWVIPGFWGHAAMMAHTADDCVIEAVSPSVVITDFRDFVFKKDYIAVLRPRFASSEQQHRTSLEAFKCVGKPYDFMLESSSVAFTCSELVWYAYSQVIPEQEYPFTKRYTLGELTVTPQDYWNAVNKFELVWTNYENHTRA